MCTIDTSPTCQVIQRVVEELILIHRVHVLDDIVPDLFERDRINERMVLDNDLCLCRAKIKMQSAGHSLDRRNDSLRTGI